MKRMLPILSIAFLLLTTPAIADKDKAPGSTCDPDNNWKNHGAYVSCVAKLHEEGKTTSEAAKSDIGKKNQDEDENEGEVEFVSPSASPSVSPSPSPSSSPNASPSASPSASPTANVTEAVNLELKALVEVLKNILESLQKLI